MSFQEELNKFIHIEGGRNLPEGKFTRNEMMLVTDLPSYREKNKNFGLYMSAYRYDSPDVKEANLYGDFYLDFDSEDNFELARQDAIRSIWYLKQRTTYDIPDKFIRIYFSGKKGVHLIIPAEIFGVEPGMNVNDHYKQMAKKIAEQLKHGTLDERIYDRRRLFRLPNSIHHDTGLHKISLTYAELVTLDIEDIKKEASRPRLVQYPPAYEIRTARTRYLEHVEEWANRFGKKFDSNKKFASKPLDFTPACIQELIDNGPMKGQRNNTAAALTSFWKKQGNSEQEVWELLVQWNNGSISEWELRNTMQSVFNGAFEYGCSALEALSTCVGEKCKLYKK